ncbi:MAG: hypothetical protein HYV63_16660 [Candidatus Schekmanbacteria bacterium]|nr:hypothetical protein [Candidatus Schekmanbacteria bacterium]
MSARDRLRIHVAGDTSERREELLRLLAEHLATRGVAVESSGGAAEVTDLTVRFVPGDISGAPPAGSTEVTVSGAWPLDQCMWVVIEHLDLVALDAAPVLPQGPGDPEDEALLRRRLRLLGYL